MSFRIEGDGPALRAPHDEAHDEVLRALLSDSKFDPETSPIPEYNRKGLARADAHSRWTYIKAKDGLDYFRETGDKIIRSNEFKEKAFIVAINVSIIATLIFLTLLPYIMPSAPGWISYPLMAALLVPCFYVVWRATVCGNRAAKLQAEKLLYNILYKKLSTYHRSKNLDSFSLGHVPLVDSRLSTDIVGKRFKKKSPNSLYFPDGSIDAEDSSLYYLPEKPNAARYVRVRDGYDIDALHLSRTDIDSLNLPLTVNAAAHQAEVNPKEEEKKWEKKRTRNGEIKPVPSFSTVERKQKKLKKPPKLIQEVYSSIYSSPEEQEKITPAPPTTKDIREAHKAQIQKLSLFHLKQELIAIQALYDEVHKLYDNLAVVYDFETLAIKLSIKKEKVAHGKKAKIEPLGNKIDNIQNAQDYYKVAAEMQTLKNQLLKAHEAQILYIEWQELSRFHLKHELIEIQALYNEVHKLYGNLAVVCEFKKLAIKLSIKKEKVAQGKKAKIEPLDNKIDNIQNARDFYKVVSEMQILKNQLLKWKEDHYSQKIAALKQRIEKLENKSTTLAQRDKFDELKGKVDRFEQRYQELELKEEENKLRGYRQLEKALDQFKKKSLTPFEKIIGKKRSKLGTVVDTFGGGTIRLIASKVFTRIKDGKNEITTNVIDREPLSDEPFLAHRQISVKKIDDMLQEYDKFLLSSIQWAHKGKPIVVIIISIVGLVLLCVFGLSNPFVNVGIISASFAGSTLCILLTKYFLPKFMKKKLEYKVQQFFLGSSMTKVPESQGDNPHLEDVEKTTNRNDLGGWEMTAGKEKPPEALAKTNETYELIQWQKEKIRRLSRELESFSQRIEIIRMTQEDIGNIENLDELLEELAQIIPIHEEIKIELAEAQNELLSLHNRLNSQLARISDFEIPRDLRTKIEDKQREYKEELDKLDKINAISLNNWEVHNKDVDKETRDRSREILLTKRRDLENKKKQLVKDAKEQEQINRKLQKERESIYTKHPEFEISLAQLQQKEIEYSHQLKSLKDELGIHRKAEHLRGLREKIISFNKTLQDKEQKLIDLSTNILAIDPSLTDTIKEENQKASILMEEITVLKDIIKRFENKELELSNDQIAIIEEESSSTRQPHPSGDKQKIKEIEAQIKEIKDKLENIQKVINLTLSIESRIVITSTTLFELRDRMTSYDSILLKLGAKKYKLTQEHSKLNDEKNKSKEEITSKLKEIERSINKIDLEIEQLQRKHEVLSAVQEGPDSTLKELNDSVENINIQLEKGRLITRKRELTEKINSSNEKEKELIEILNDKLATGKIKKRETAEYYFIIGIGHAKDCAVAEINEITKKLNKVSGVPIEDSQETLLAKRKNLLHIIKLKEIEAKETTSDASLLEEARNIAMAHTINKRIDLIVKDIIASEKELNELAKKSGDIKEEIEEIKKKRRNLELNLKTNFNDLINFEMNPQTFYCKYKTVKKIFKRADIRLNLQSVKALAQSKYHSSG